MLASGLSPVAVWVSDPSGASQVVAQAQAVLVFEQVPRGTMGDMVAPGMAAKTSADSPRDVSKSTDKVCLADAANCEIYVCFEGQI